MSSTIDYPDCPNCQEMAYAEQDNRTCETRLSCNKCGYYRENEEVINEGVKFKVGDQIGYHGREGEIIELLKNSAIVEFSDTGEEDDISFKELIEQGN